MVLTTSRVLHPLTPEVVEQTVCSIVVTDAGMVVTVSVEDVDRLLVVKVPKRVAVGVD